MKGKKYCIGIDIGGSKVRGVLWDERGVIAASGFPTPRGIRAFRKRLVALVAKLMRRAKGKIRGVGIGAAGTIQGTRVISSRNIPYLKQFDFRSIFPNGALRLDNDARAFARAEWLAGAGRGAKRILVFTIGTGIGRAYGKNGRIARLKRFEYSERGEKRYQKIRDAGSDKALADFLSGALVPLVKEYRPSVVLVGGGVMGRPGFLAKLRTEFKKRGMRTPIRRARMGKNAAAIGAALLFSFN